MQKQFSSNKPLCKRLCHYPVTMELSNCNMLVRDSRKDELKMKRVGNWEETAISVARKAPRLKGVLYKYGSLYAG